MCEYICVCECENEDEVCVRERERGEGFEAAVREREGVCGGGEAERV